jgi:glycerol-3-phosphate acyltransferase PlsY
VIGQGLLIAASYVAGSLPFGYWIVRALRGADIRLVGSGNTGATNVWRSYGWKLGAPTLALDMLKGALPALAGLVLFGEGTAVLCAAAALIGHAFPIFLGLGGGKGVATGAGALLVIAPEGFVCAAVAFVLVLWLFRYVSLASFTAAAVAIGVAVATDRSWPVIAFLTIGGLLVLLRHAANIRRLRAGTEPQISSFGRRKRPKVSPR